MTTTPHHSLVPNRFTIRLHPIFQSPSPHARFTRGLGISIIYTSNLAERKNKKDTTPLNINYTYRRYRLFQLSLQAHNLRIASAKSSWAWIRFSSASNWSSWACTRCSSDAPSRLGPISVLVDRLDPAAIWRGVYFPGGHLNLLPYRIRLVG